MRLTLTLTATLAEPDAGSILHWACIITEYLPDALSGDLSFAEQGFGLEEKNTGENSLVGECQFVLGTQRLPLGLFLSQGSSGKHWFQPVALMQVNL